MSKYHKITLIAGVEKFEELTANLLLLGIESLEETDNSLVFYTDDNIKYGTDEIVSALKNRFPDINIEVNESPEKNWNEIWARSIEPVYIKDKIVIYPSWKKKSINLNIPVKIEIDPKMSFGTGHNETTQLVLELMGDYISKNDKYMLDFGSGTGILGIAGIKMGIEKVIAIDIDDDAIINSKEYFINNNVSDSVTLYQCRLSDISETGFDVIAANIISGVIKSNIDTVHSKLKQNGKLFLSGILNTELGEISDFLNNNGFKIKKTLEKAEWLGIYCLKK